MMKRFLLVCALVVVVASSASALPNYIWNTGGYDQNGSNGAYTFYGVQAAGIGTTPLSVGSTFAAVASLAYTGTVGAGMVKTSLNAKNFVAAPGPSSYILQAWGGADFAGTALSVRVWANTAPANIPAATWNLYKLYDPISMVWGRTLLNTSPIMATSNGTSANPWFMASLPVFKTGSPLAAGQGYILEMSSVPVPEPGSMVAMLSGLVGLVGFGIRRRR